MGHALALRCRFQNEKYDDRSMEASYKDILAEERRSARLGEWLRCANVLPRKI